MTVSFSTAPDPSRGPRWRTGVGAAVVLVLAALVVTVVVSALSTAGGAGTTTITSPPSTGASSDPGAPGGAGASAGDADGALFVHVHGAVVSPGLYELAAGARVVDVVAAAGGFADGADQAGVNLARPLVDGEQLRVPAVGEPAAAVGDGGGGAAGAGGAAGGAGVGGAGAGGAAAVDLNLADDAALQTLPGVGPATAAAILDWREQNGAFRSVDDLLGVPGIGEKTLEKLRPQVTV
ncbi:ComEA family DNA-binding protein [Frigoribacterium sp. CFBP 13712]|uniref:ComEA family DNA-binding protein n=1 Tax=Frigoribacterium sp. CFBP 13712 TaxID=2775309 RepID=UPI0017812820|nr:ComEA family DNA-binding protein [Frigoribacterium sp. CFBP 13712]MBD8702183.1 ComEA family DNA-binding protein [Frigoribacterium sp. CFBP 13712]